MKNANYIITPTQKKICLGIVRENYLYFEAGVNNPYHTTDVFLEIPRIQLTQQIAEIIQGIFLCCLRVICLY